VLNKDNASSLKFGGSDDKEIRNNCYVFLALVFFNASVKAQSNDVKGWAKTTWGMSQQEIIKLYPEAKPLKKGEGYMVDVCIGNNRCDVFLTTTGNKLREVTIHVPRDAAREELYEEFKKSLSAKYGLPTFSNRVPGPLSYKLSSTWTFPSTTIELEYLKLDGRPVGNMPRIKDFNALSIKYRPNVSNDNL
jgi:hypothetical protein